MHTHNGAKSAGKTFETWLRPPVDLGGLRHVPSAGNVQCTLPHGPKLGLARLLLRALFAQLRRCLHRGFFCNGMETRRVSDGRRGWWRKGVAGGRAGRQLTDAGLILDTNHRRVNVAGAFARSSARLERRPQRITRWLAPVGRRGRRAAPELCRRHAARRWSARAAVCGANPGAKLTTRLRQRRSLARTCARPPRCGSATRKQLSRELKPPIQLQRREIRSALADGLPAAPAAEPAQRRGQGLTPRGTAACAAWRRTPRPQFARDHAVPSELLS